MARKRRAFLKEDETSARHPLLETCAVCAPRPWLGVRTPLHYSARRAEVGDIVDAAAAAARVEIGLLLSCAHCRVLRAAQSLARGYGATAARLTPDQKVGSSNLSALIFAERRAAATTPTKTNAIVHFLQFF